MRLARRLRLAASSAPVAAGVTVGVALVERQAYPEVLLSRVLLSSAIAFVLTAVLLGLLREP